MSDQTTEPMQVMLIGGDHDHRLMVETPIAHETRGRVIVVAEASAPGLGAIRQMLASVEMETREKRPADAISGLPRNRKQRRAMARGQRW